METHYCMYCEFYGFEFRGTLGEVLVHVLEHPINVDPLPIEDDEED